MNKITKVFAGFCIMVFSMQTSLVAREFPTKNILNLDIAREIAAAAEKKAIENKWHVAIVIVDDGGELVLLEKMDGTQKGSIEVAIQKAKTAMFFKRPTKAFEDALTEGKNFLLSIPDWTILIEGGVPVLIGEDIVGGLGISGMSPQQDGIIAQAALDRLSEMQKK